MHERVSAIEALIARSDAFCTTSPAPSFLSTSKSHKSLIPRPLLSDWGTRPPAQASFSERYQLARSPTLGAGWAQKVP